MQVGSSHDDGATPSPGAISNPEEGQLDEPSNLPTLNLDPPDSKDLLVYTDPRTGKMKYLDLRTGKPYEQYTPVANQGAFSNEAADMICASIREGKSLTKICQENQISLSLFYAWLSIFPEFKKRYTEARKQRADYHFHRVVELADGGIGMDKEFIPGLKLAVDAHKWAAEKSDPERFAKPKEEGNTSSSITINLQTGVLDRQAPKDILVDQFGNFQGFGDSPIVEEEIIEAEVTNLSTNRWGEYDGEFKTESSSSEDEEARSNGSSE